MATPATELFALTDEQIVGLTPQDAPSATEAPPEPQKELAAQTHTNTEFPNAPTWLSEKMRDPWHGDEAKDLWEEKQKADKEIAAYREAFTTTADAKALKELYPGGVTEAKATAERARELDAIDAAFYRGDAAARTELAKRMMQQDPAAFRDMVEAGLKLLDNSAANERNAPGQPAAAVQAPAQTETPPEALRAYGEFERAANAELEQSVGTSIARVLEEALPNLRLSGARGREGEPGTAPLWDRLTTAVREEVESALKSDNQLGEQVARILSGRRFDPSARAQVVRLIDTRAQQLVPGAVRRVVTSWTQATLGAKAKSPAPENAQRTEKPTVTRGRRVDYARTTDEQILNL